MARECTACLSQDRHSIDAMLARRAPLRKISELFKISKSSIYRHRAHIADDLAATSQARALRAGDSLAQQLASLVDDARKIQREAEAGKDSRTGLLAIRELTRLVELSAKLSGELTSRHSVTVTVQQVPSESEALELSRDCLLALATPDQQRAFAHELLARADEGDHLLLEAPVDFGVPTQSADASDREGEP